MSLSGGELLNMLVYCIFFSLRLGFISLGFTGKVFNETGLSSDGYLRGSVINNSLRNVNDHIFTSESLWIYLLLH